MVELEYDISYVPNSIVKEFTVDDCECVNVMNIMIDDEVAKILKDGKTIEGILALTAKQLEKLVKKCVALKRISNNILQ